MRGRGDAAHGAIVGDPNPRGSGSVPSSMPLAGRKSTTSSFRMGREGVAKDGNIRIPVPPNQQPKEFAL